MKRFHRLKTGTVTLMAMMMSTSAIAPLLILSPANAQFRTAQNRTRDITISSGARIPTTYDKDKILVAKGETTDITLKVASNITDSQGNILIPRDSKIKGKIQPSNRSSQQGAQFVAREIEYPSGQKQNFNASSDVITRTEKVQRGAKTGEILTDAAYGAGAAALISLVTGNKKIEVGELLGGGGAGALASILLRKSNSELISIDPQNDLTLRLTSPLTVSVNNRFY
ncbi:hypothetical protein [Calothrix sp. PCC 6303]|uniref:hypothetical protein n=1 Tax=Calothrix sp. PCC 6303 TaxID=1170562 RepID=UPI0002A01F01|nr:hypothetical protein [Calothrix sp. PCC 6303]AFZ03016.1 hypothetical protein Cal6303_4102 [Calothrix sp. PCC 6303]